MRAFAKPALLLGCLVAASAAQAADRTVTLNVEGMTCASCPYILRQSLASVAGVVAVDVPFDDKIAVVTFDDSTAEAADLTQPTAAMGFPAQVEPLAPGPARGPPPASARSAGVQVGQDVYRK